MLPRPRPGEDPVPLDRLPTFIYNAKVSEDRYFRAFRNHSLALTGQHTPVDQRYSQFKDQELTPWLYHVPSIILRNGATRFMQAYQRFFKGLSGRPTFRKKHGRQTVWVTNELFWFEGSKLYLGPRLHPLGQLKFKAHLPYDPPASITISRHASKWYVSFTQEVAGVKYSEADLVDHFGSMTLQELEPIVLGIDRGVEIPAKVSDDESCRFSDVQIKRMRHQEKRRKKLQERVHDSRRDRTARRKQP